MDSQSNQSEAYSHLPNIYTHKFSRTLSKRATHKLSFPRNRIGSIVTSHRYILKSQPIYGYLHWLPIEILTMVLSYLPPYERFLLSMMYPELLRSQLYRFIYKHAFIPSTSFLVPYRHSAELVCDVLKYPIVNCRNILSRTSVMDSIVAFNKTNLRPAYFVTKCDGSPPLITAVNVSKDANESCSILTRVNYHISSLFHGYCENQDVLNKSTFFRFWFKKTFRKSCVNIYVLKNRIVRAWDSYSKMFSEYPPQEIRGKDAIKVALILGYQKKDKMIIQNVKRMEDCPSCSLKITYNRDFPNHCNRTSSLIRITYCEEHYQE
jgi:hypothetical protein